MRRHSTVAMQDKRMNKFGGQNSRQQFSTLFGGQSRPYSEFMCVTTLNELETSSLCRRRPSGWTQHFSIMVFWIDNGVLNLSVGMNRQGWCGWNRKFGLESDVPNQMWVDLRSGVSWVEQSTGRVGNAREMRLADFNQFCPVLRKYYSQTYQMRPAN